MEFAGKTVSNAQIVAALDRMRDEPFSTKQLAEALAAEGADASCCREFAGRVMQKFRAAGLVENRNRIWHVLPGAALEYGEVNIDSQWAD